MVFLLILLVIQRSSLIIPEDMGSDTSIPTDDLPLLNIDEKKRREWIKILYTASSSIPLGCDLRVHVLDD